jgi:phospholipase/carboxylesterase
MTKKEELLETIAASLIPLLQAMDTLTWARQRFEPYGIDLIVNAIRDNPETLEAALATLRSRKWPSELKTFKGILEKSSIATLDAYKGLKEAAKLDGFDALLQAHRSIKEHILAERTLYSAADISTPISQYYLPQEYRETKDLLEKIESGADQDVPLGGITEHSMQNGKNLTEYAVYIPEYLDPAVAAPVVLALHGGKGSGKDFIWSWLPAARALGTVLIAPNARDKTWAIAGEDLDSSTLDRALEEVEKHQNLDRKKVLMTGMSDGGTFCYVSGHFNNSCATHLAPFSASFHPMLLEFISSDRLQHLPIRIVHGTRDWMFPIELAHQAKECFRASGADITFVELTDRSHVFPQDEASSTLDWFLNGVS